MDSRRLLTGGLALCLVVVMWSACDNDDLTEERALQVFGTKEPSDDAWTDTISVAWTDTLSSYYAWTDTISGLTWQVEPTGGVMDWSDAKAHCSGLSLGGESWRLPTIGELRTLIRGCPGTVTGGACGVTDGCLDSSCNDDGGCWDCSSFPVNSGPADGCYWPDSMKGACSWYWSSSAVAANDYDAWGVSFGDGDVNIGTVDDGRHVRCVR